MKSKQLKIQSIKLTKQSVTTLVDGLKSIETIMTLSSFIIVSISLAKPVSPSLKITHTTLKFPIKQIGNFTDMDNLSNTLYLFINAPLSHSVWKSSKIIRYCTWNNSEKQNRHQYPQKPIRHSTYRQINRHTNRQSNNRDRNRDAQTDAYETTYKWMTRPIRKTTRRWPRNVWINNYGTDNR